MSRTPDGEALVTEALDLALALEHPVQDCVYLALAEREGCELVTADDKLVRTLRSSYPFIVDLKNLA